MRFADSIVWKNKSFPWKGHRQEKNLRFCICYLWKMKEKPANLNRGVCFFYEVEGHMPKLSSFGQGKNIRPKKSLTSFLHAALHLFLVSKTLVCKYRDNLGENIFTLSEGCFLPLLQ